MSSDRFDALFARLSRRRAIGGLGAATAGATVLSRLGGALGAPAAAAPMIGVAKNGRNAFEFLVQIEQSAFDFEIVGYLTYINGLAPASIFTNGDPLDHDETHARFTLVSNATGIARSWHDTVFSMTVTGDLRIFYNKPGGSTFNDPGTFSHGKVIASGSVRLQNVIDATGPQDGIANGWGQISLAKTPLFKIDGKEYQFGNKGLYYRASFAGSGILTDRDVPNSTITVAGNGVVVREA